MSGYWHAIEADVFGYESPWADIPSANAKAKLILALYKSQEMTPEEMTERKTRLDAAFQAIRDKWEAKSCE